MKVPLVLSSITALALVAAPGNAQTTHPWLYRTQADASNSSSRPLLDLRSVRIGEVEHWIVYVDDRPATLTGVEQPPPGGKKWFVLLPDEATAPLERVPESDSTPRAIRLYAPGGAAIAVDGLGVEVLADESKRAWAFIDDSFQPIALPNGVAASLGNVPDEFREAFAQLDGQMIELPKTLDGVAKEMADNLAGDDELVERRVKDALHDPEILNRVLNGAIENDSGLAFLKDVNLEFVTFDADQGQNGLGFRYSYERSMAPDWSERSDDKRNVLTGTEYSLHASGNVAFDSDVNPADFLETSLSWNWFRNQGGIVRVDDTVAAGGQSMTRAEWQERIWSGVSKMAQITDEAELRASPALRDVLDQLRPYLTDQWYVEFALDASLESNQRFTAKNYVVGAHVGVDVKAWNDQSKLAKYNLFDHPAALLRVLTRYDQSFTPRGSSLPTLLLAIDRVQPDGDDPRAQIGDSSDYWRGSFEVAYRSPVARYGGVEYHLGASWRTYLELSPSDVVERNDLDDYDRLVLTLASEQGLFLSYSSGRLPFDVDETEVVELGFKVHL